MHHELHFLADAVACGCQFLQCLPMDLNQQLSRRCSSTLFSVSLRLQLFGPTSYWFLWLFSPQAASVGLSRL